MQKIIRITILLTLFAITGSISSMQKIREYSNNVKTALAKTIVDPWTLGVPAVLIGLLFWYEADTKGVAIENFDFLSALKISLPISLCGALGTFIKNLIPCYKNNSLAKTALEHPYLLTHFTSFLLCSPSKNDDNKNFKTFEILILSSLLTLIWAKNYLELQNTQSEQETAPLLSQIPQ
jgi:hypothetical protein